MEKKGLLLASVFLGCSLLFWLGPWGCAVQPAVTQIEPAEPDEVAEEYVPTNDPAVVAMDAIPLDDPRGYWIAPVVGVGGVIIEPGFWTPYRGVVIYHIDRYHGAHRGDFFIHREHWGRYSSFHNRIYPEHRVGARGQHERPKMGKKPGEVRKDPGKGSPKVDRGKPKGQTSKPGVAAPKADKSKKPAKKDKKDKKDK